MTSMLPLCLVGGTRLLLLVSTRDGISSNSSSSMNGSNAPSCKSAGNLSINVGEADEDYKPDLLPGPVSSVIVLGTLNISPWPLPAPIPLFSLAKRALLATCAAIWVSSEKQPEFKRSKSTSC